MCWTHGIKRPGLGCYIKPVWQVHCSLSSNPSPASWVLTVGGGEQKLFLRQRWISRFHTLDTSINRYFNTPFTNTFLKFKWNSGNTLVLKDDWASLLCLDRAGCYCRYKHFIGKIFFRPGHFLINVSSRCDSAVLDLSEGGNQWLDWGHTPRTDPSSVLWMSVPSDVHEN